MGIDINLNMVIDELTPHQRLITHSHVRRLLGQLPADGAHEVVLKKIGKEWVFKFTFVSICTSFSAVGQGATPERAFAFADRSMQQQIAEWHQTRTVTDSTSAIPEVQKVAGRNKSLELANVLIVDDDLDTALKMQTIFNQFGCRTMIVTDTLEAERMLSLGDADIIILDWMLEPGVEADQVVRKSVKMIDSFDDLKEQFTESKPKVITYSSLANDEIGFPTNCYFDYKGHWPKYIGYKELQEKASDLLKESGFN
jgi:CheY-like chemotaxis protein